MKYTDNPLNAEFECHGNTTEAEYAALPGYRLSIVAACHGPLALSQALNASFMEPTTATDEGILAHLLVLEPEKFEATYEVHPSKTIFTQKLKAEVASRNKIPIKEKHLAEAAYWAEILKNNGRWQSYGEFDAEISYTIGVADYRDWESFSQLTLKTRVDAVFSDRVADIKFVHSNYPLALQSSCNKYNYPLKMAFQAMAAGKDKAELVCVSKEKYPSIVYIDVPVAPLIDRCEEHIRRLCDIESDLELALSNKEWSELVQEKEATWVGLYDLVMADQ